MDNIKKHFDKLKKAIDIKLGKGKGIEILSEFDSLAGSETPDEIGRWANDVCSHLESTINTDDLVAIREECACIKANKYSAYNKKYFKELRAVHPNDDMAYLKAVAEFMNGRGRCGKKVEFVDEEIISHFGFGDSCVCYVIKGGWKKPPSKTWCRCCQGTLKSIYQFVFNDKICHMYIVETFATGGNDCVFSTWFTDK
jgi:hypothetical protein